MKILIENIKNRLTFSTYKKVIPQEDLNNTNIISAEKIIFEDKYIFENKELIISFLKTVILKEKINIVNIKQNSIAEIVLKIVSNIEYIDSVYFLEDQPISYDIGSLLFDDSNILYLNCYAMPSFLFDRLNMLHSIKIDIRSETLYESNFMNYNNLSTYSNIYYRKLVVIKEDISKDDFENMDAFFDINTKLKIIILEIYSEDIIKKLFHLLNKHNVFKIKIVIIQKNKETDILNQCINLIKNVYEIVLEKQSIIIKIKYSDDYKKTMTIKQMNLSLVRMIAIVILISSLLVIGIIKIEEKKIKNNLEGIKDIKEEVFGKDPFIENDDPGIINDEPTEKEQETSYRNAYSEKYERIFSKLLEINSDTVGWLTVKNTAIDYPVVQKNDNTFYLTRDFYRENNIMGWVFLDYRNDSKNLSQNNIIYGHDTPFGLLFGTLRTVLNKSWYENRDNQIITFNTIHKNLQWRIFSIYTIPVTNDYLTSSFSSSNSFAYFIQKMKERSIYDFEIEVGATDKILTLSTCYNDSNYRLVVHAKLIN